MAKRKTTKQLREALLSQRTEDKARKKLRKALSGFHPRKSERGRYVFISTGGKRLDVNSKRKGYLVYVNRKGKRTVELEPAFRRKAHRVAGGKLPSPKPLSVRTYHLSGLKRPGAAKKLRPITRRTALKPTKLRVLSDKTREGVSFDRITTRVSDKLWGEVKYQVGRVTYVIQVTFSVRVEGRIESFKFWLEYFYAGRSQRDKRNVSKFVRAALYQFLAQELSKHDYVTAGSAAFIRRMNPGKKVKDWLDRDGNKWEKNEWQRVTIQSFEFEILRVQ